MTKPRLAINGFGRMGRLALRAGLDGGAWELAAVNDPGAAPETFALLTEFDSVQGRWDRPCGATDDTIRFGDLAVPFLAESDPAELPWRDLGVDVVLECTGRFRSRATLRPHFDAGARRVVVSVPVKDIEANIVIGVNDADFDLGAHDIVTAASCTTNALAPIVKALHEGIGVERGTVTTLHAPTNTQRVHDGPHKDPRRARAAFESMIPTSSNSSYAVTLAIPELRGKLDSLAVRVPTLSASLVDLSAVLSRATGTDEVKQVLRAAAGPVLGVEDRPLVGADFTGDPRSVVVDLPSVRVTDGRLAKVLGWYDNEWGYANRLVELAARVVAQLPAG